MTIVHWSPFADFRRMDELMNRARSAEPRNGHADRQWSVPLDVARDGESFIVKASLPGVDSEKIDVNVDENVLEIKANTEAESEERQDGVLLRERRTGTFYRSIRLPEAIDHAKAESNYKDGVLTVTLPVQESTKARKLKVIAA